MGTIRIKVWEAKLILASMLILAVVVFACAISEDICYFFVNLGNQASDYLFNLIFDRPDPVEDTSQSSSFPSVADHLFIK